MKILRVLLLIDMVYTRIIKVYIGQNEKFLPTTSTVTEETPTPFFQR